VDGRWARMPTRAASTCLPRRDHRAGDATTAADERPGQGCRDPGPPPPNHGPRAATARPEDPVHRRWPGVARRATAPTAPHRATSDPAAGPPAINHLADSSPRP